MKPSEVIPGFDCVAMKQQVQDRIYEEIRDLSPEEEIRHFEEQALKGPLGDLWRRLISKNRRPAAGPGANP